MAAIEKHDTTLVIICSCLSSSQLAQEPQEAQDYREQNHALLDTESSGVEGCSAVVHLISLACIHMMCVYAISKHVVYPAGYLKIDANRRWF